MTQVSLLDGLAIHIAPRCHDHLHAETFGIVGEFVPHRLANRENEWRDRDKQSDPDNCEREDCDLSAFNQRKDARRQEANR